MSDEEKRSVYLESSFVSYTANRLSNDFLASAHQRFSKQWWEQRRDDFQFFVSDAVYDEVSQGNESEATKRVSLIRDLPVLNISEEVETLALDLMRASLLPSKAFQDALHVAVSAINGIDYLLSWNCTHIVNYEIYLKVKSKIEEQGYQAPWVCTPIDLGGELKDE